MVRRITDIKKNPKVAAISWREIAYRHIGVIGAQPPADNLNPFPVHFTSDMKSPRGLVGLRPSAQRSLTRPPMAEPPIS